MPKRKNVGRGWRTPAKHHLLNKVVGRIAGAATTNKVGSNRFIGYDLCAGDGVPADCFDFWSGTSPGILIKHAANTTKQPYSSKLRRLQTAIVFLYEINPNTFARLIDSLTTHLGSATAFESGKARFDYVTDTKTVTVIAFCDSGKNADLGCVSPGDCVVICNDPNSIHDFAMRPTMIQEILDKTWMCTTFSTLGCNTGGLMMKSFEERQMWYGHLHAIKDYLPRYTDLVLAAIDHDASKWAYAITVPAKWRNIIHEDIETAFAKIGRVMRIAWWRREFLRFMELEDVLFLRKTEREGM